MRRYISYLRYVINHKWFVLLSCWEKGLRWQGIIHDMSKLRLDEFIPYAKFFYNKDGSKRQIRDKTGYYKPYDTGDKAFDFAWLLHQKRNKHHWQWWILPLDDGGNKVITMDYKYMNEMMCDWQGASMAQGYGKETKEWYFKNKNKMILSKYTTAQIETLYKIFDN